jgi:cellulose biosynthesis protein BcsQ
MKRIMAVYDVDLFYADRFAEFANEKEKTPFTAVAFDSMDKLRKFTEQQTVEVLLVGSRVPEDNLAGLKVGQIIRLSEDGRELQEGTGTTGSVIYKYQSSDAVLREVMTCYQVRAEQTPATVVRLKSDIMGVCSPSGRCGKTGFCLTLGQELAKGRKVLYLNLEDFSGLSAMMGVDFQGTLSDLMYFYRQGEYSRIRLDTVLYSWGGLDYVPPVRYAEDLNEMPGEELAGLVRAIAGDGRYDVIVLDIGHLCRDAEALLELCSVIYAPVGDDCVSEAKIEEWKRYLEESGRGHIRDRLQILRLPVPKGKNRIDTYLEQLRWGGMGDFVRNLLYQKVEGRLS